VFNRHTTIAFNGVEKKKPDTRSAANCCYSVYLYFCE